MEFLTSRMVVWCQGAFSGSNPAVMTLVLPLWGAASRLDLGVNTDMNAWRYPEFAQGRWQDFGGSLSLTGLDLSASREFDSRDKVGSWSNCGQIQSWQSWDGEPLMPKYERHHRAYPDLGWNPWAMGRCRATTGARRPQEGLAVCDACVILRWHGKCACECFSEDLFAVEMI